jgi:Zn-dependent protease
MKLPFFPHSHPTSAALNLPNRSLEATSTNSPHVSKLPRWFVKRWNVGEIAGIPTYLHWSLPVPLLIFVPIQILQLGWPLGGISLLSFPIAMLIVTLHELGHCGAAAHFKMKAHSITLTGIGGIASIAEPPTARPQENLIVAAAGPAVNVVILLIMLLTIGIPTPQMILAIGENPFASTTHLYTIAFIVNAAILIFNLVPVYPMDGGRILKEIGEICFGKRAAVALIFTGCFAAGSQIAALLFSHGVILGAAIIAVMSMLGIMEGLSILEREKAKSNLHKAPECNLPD